MQAKLSTVSRRAANLPAASIRVSQADAVGNWSGLDADFCKALAAVILNDASKVKWVPLNSQQRLPALQSGEIDVLSRNTTFTLTRDASLGLHITSPLYYDGQGFMVPAKSGIKDVRQLKGKLLRALRLDDRKEPRRLLTRQ